MSAKERTSAPAAAGDEFKKAKRLIDRALKQHDSRCERYKRREDAWLARNRTPNEPSRVRFAYQRMDVLLSYITAEKPVGRVAPLEASQKCIDAAKLMDKAINEWRRRDNRDLKQYEWMLTALVYGVAPAKSYWVNDRAEVSWRVPITDPVTGEPSGEKRMTKEVDVKDQPSLQLINPYDFAWDPSATESDLSDAQYVCYWSFPTLDELKEGEKEGRYHNIKDVSELKSGSQQASKNRQGQARDLTGRVEVCEVWTRSRLVVIANGLVCIRDEPNPFLHHELPFIIGTTMPNLTGSIETSSEVELIAPIQQNLWHIYEQYGINLKRANELTVLFDGRMGDPEPILNVLANGTRQRMGTAIAYEATNDQPPVTWSPTTALLTAGQAGMEGYKQDMDDMSGVGPYVSGTEEQAVDPKTATEVSTLQGASMRRINKTRNMLGSALQRASNLELKLTRQFMNKPLQIRIEGYDPDAAIPGDAWSFDFVDPNAIMDADLEYVIRDADESMDQEQKRTEASVRLQMTLETAAASMALGQGTPNVKKAFEEYIEAYGEEDAKDWWLEPPPPMLPAMAPMPPNGAGPIGPGGLGAPPLAPATPPQGGPGRAAPNPVGAR